MASSTMRPVVQSVEGISAGRQDDPSSTPAMRQWTEQKAQAGDALLPAAVDGGDQDE